MCTGWLRSRFMDLKTLLKYGSRDHLSLEGAKEIVVEAMERVAGLP